MDLLYRFWVYGSSAHVTVISLLVSLGKDPNKLALNIFTKNSVQQLRGKCCLVKRSGSWSKLTKVELRAAALTSRESVPHLKSDQA